MHIRQPEITPGVTIGQLLVIESEERENRRMQIVNMDWFVHGLETEFIRRAWNGEALDRNSVAVTKCRTQEPLP